MAERVQFELVFALPEGEHDSIDLSNAITLHEPDPATIDFVSRQRKDGDLPVH